MSTRSTYTATVHRRTRRGAAASAAALATSLAVATLGFSAAQASPSTDDADPRRWVEGDHTIAAFDMDQSIVENVDVKSEVDGDLDGKNDTIRVQITRPDTSEDEKVPLIVHASPYFFKGGRGAWETNFFVPFGYAVATVSLTGTDFSTGCDDVGGELEFLGTKAVVDWVNGRTTAKFVGGGEAVADWATGAVGMIGVSWDGTIANSIAATGVDGLKTIVPVAAISSWYDYTRSWGVTYYDDHVGFLHEYVSNFDSQYCHELTPILNQAADDATSSRNDFWAERGYRPEASNIKASVFVVHGLNDENVKTGQFGLWWKELEEHGIERKLFLHQQQHIDPVSFGSIYTDPLHEWFDYYLQDLDNGVPDGPQAIIQRETGSWSTDKVWPPKGTEDVTMQLSKPLGRVGGLSVDGAGDAAQAKTAKIVQSVAHSDDSIVANPDTPRADRAVFLSKELDEAIRESGTAKVKLRVKVDEVLAGFQARVVDYTSGSGFVVSRTMASLNHHAGLRQYELLEPGKYYTLKWRINTDDRIYAEGHRLGLVLTAEQQNIEGPYTPFTATINLKKSSLKIPLNDATTAPSGLDSVDSPVGTTVANPLKAKSLEEFTREFLMQGTN